MARLTVAQWAEEQGISKVAAYKRINTGKVTRDSDGMIDADKAAMDWARSRDPRAAAKNPSGQKKSAEPSAAAGKRECREREIPTGSLAEAQREHEWLKIKQREIEVAEAEGRLLARDEVKEAVDRMLARFRSRILTIADELCDRVAAEADAVRCREMIDRKLCDALSQLAEYPGAAGATEYPAGA